MSNSQSIQDDPDPKLRDLIARALAPVELQGLSKSELEAILDAESPQPFVDDQLEFLFEKLDVLLREESKKPPRTTSDLDDTLSLPSSPVLGFLGSLTNLGGSFTPTLWTLLVLVSGMALTAALVLLAIRGIRVEVNRLEMAQQEKGEQEKGRSSRRPVPASPLLPFSPSPFPSSPARLVRTKDCRWNSQSSAPQIGQALPVGQVLNLASGVAEIQFGIGAKIILQSPAAFQLLSAKSARLEMGKAMVEIKNPAARGFTILTPETTFVDLGTEFGVEVTPGGNSKIHVFKGQVDVDQKPREGQPAPLTQRLVENAGARMKAGEEGMMLVEDTGECFIRSMDEADRDQHVVAYWRFEDRPVGVLLPDTLGNSLPTCATVDSSFNGNDLYVAQTRNRPVISADVPAGLLPQTGSPNRSCLDTSQPGTEINRLNVYTHSQFSHASPLDIQKIAPPQWTIEASVKAAKLFGKAQGFLGRDANFTAPGTRNPARLTFQIDARDRFAISFYDASGRFHEAIAEDLRIETGRWYHLAATSDGRALRLYVDALDGRGYLQRAVQELPATGSTALGKGQDDAEWTIGRAGNAGNPADWLRFWGWIDEVRVSDIARNPADFLFSPKGADRE